MKQRLHKKILSLALLPLAFSINAYGAEEGFPPTCKGIAVEKELINVEAKQAVIVLMRNQSSNDVWVTHPVADPSASAGWSSRLEAGKWSALALSESTFELGCIESKPGHEQQIPCAGTLAVCLWPVENIKQEKGASWAAENMNLSALAAHLEGRGYKLPDLVK